MSRTLKFTIPIMLVGFTLLAILVTWNRNSLTRSEEPLTTWCAKFTKDSPTLRSIVVFSTSLGAGDRLLAIGFALTISLITNRLWIHGFVFSLFALSAIKLSPFLKGIFERQRPPTTPLPISFDSFPSGHALGSAVVYGFMLIWTFQRCRNLRWRWSLLILIGIWIIWMLICRLLLGVHYLSDVTAGCLIGLAWTFIAWEVADHLVHRYFQKNHSSTIKY